MESATEFYDSITRAADGGWLGQCKDEFMFKGLALIAYQLEQATVALNNIIENMDILVQGKLYRR